MAKKKTTTAAQKSGKINAAKKKEPKQERYNPPRLTADFLQLEAGQSCKGTRTETEDTENAVTRCGTSSTGSENFREQNERPFHLF